MNLQYFIRVAVCAAIVALLMAGAGLFPAQSVAGQEAGTGTLQGSDAIEQLKQDGQYDSLNAGFFPGQPIARLDNSESPAVTRQHQSRQVRWVPGFSILHQLEYCLSQRFGLYWFLPGCWVCDQDALEIHNQVPCAGRLAVPQTDDE